MQGLSLVVASGGHSSSWCAGLSLLWLQSTGSRGAGSVIVAHGPSCSMARGIFPDQGSNPCPLHWQADSQPLRHQGNPLQGLLNLCARNQGQRQYIPYYNTTDKAFFGGIYLRVVLLSYNKCISLGLLENGK